VPALFIAQTRENLTLNFNQFSTLRPNMMPLRPNADQMASLRHQLTGRGREIDDPRIIRAMIEIPRHYGKTPILTGLFRLDLGRPFRSPTLWRS
jgi:hypothetical protein